jgi:beta-glucosidase
MASRSFLAGLCCFGLIALSARAVPARAESRADAMLQRMTLDEKLGQLVQRAGGRSKALNSRLDEKELERVRAGQVGSYLHVAGAEPLGNLQRVAVEESRLGIPLLFAMDVVHGYRTVFPVPLALAATWSPATVERATRVAAIEATAAGLHWTFAPMIDVARDARWGRVVEGAGEDPYLGAVMARAQIRGYQGERLSDADTMMATAKHFGAYGAAAGGRDYDTAPVGPRDLNEVYLPPFHAAVDSGVASIMTAFNDIDGVPTTSNRALLRGVLREQWGFDGVNISDWNAILELTQHGVAADRGDAAVLALRAGVDMDMVSDVYATDLKARIEAEPALLRDLDAAVLRLLRTKEALGLFDRPMQYHDTARESALMLSPAHIEAAREAATQAIVLLKNDAALLPLDPARLKTLAVVGALADDPLSALGSWRGQGRVEDVVTLLPALRAALPGVQVNFAAGADPRTADASGIDAALQLVGAADATVLMIGEHFDLSGEARSRADIGLPPSQLELAKRVLASGKPVVVVLANGRPLELSWLAQHAPALLETWMLGVQGGPAIADVLLGKRAPGGKLPMQFPRHGGALPGHYGARPSGRPANADLTQDTVRYHDLDITPLFPFGHGLSYSEFAYAPLAQDRSTLARGERITLSFELRNSGARRADEVVQLYVRDRVASVARPVQELRGFKRVTLDPGAAATVRFTLRPEQFALFDSEGRWQVEAGDFDVMIGSSSQDIRLRGQFRVAQGFSASAPGASIETLVE